MPTAVDVFLLTIPAAAEPTVDADVDVTGVTVTPLGGSPSQGTHSFSAAFTYVSGDPAATGFEFTWRSVNPAGNIPALPTISPASPQGSGSQIRTGTISGAVAASQTTTYGGRITILQS